MENPSSEPAADVDGARKRAAAQSVLGLALICSISICSLHALLSSLAHAAIPAFIPLLVSVTQRDLEAEVWRWGFSLC